MTDNDAIACRATCRQTHINGECRSRCMVHVRDQNFGAGFIQNAAAADALHTAERAQAQSVFTAYSAAQRRVRQTT
jgi:hypothetical protein